MDMPKRPIGGSFAWTVPEVMQRDDWICRLAKSDVAEIDAAVLATRQRGLGIQEIGRDDFPLDRLTTRLGALRAQIRSGLGFGYIKGLPVERYDREGADELKAAVAPLRQELRQMEAPYRELLAQAKYRKYPENVQRAIAKASESVRNIHWFQVVETRGHVAEGKVAHWQVTIKVGFTLE